MDPATAMMQMSQSAAAPSAQSASAPSALSIFNPMKSLARAPTSSRVAAPGSSTPRPTDPPSIEPDPPATSVVEQFAPAASPSTPPDAPPSPPEVPPPEVPPPDPQPSPPASSRYAPAVPTHGRMPSPAPSPPGAADAPALKKGFAPKDVTTFVFHRNYIETTALSLASHSASSWATVQMLLDPKVAAHLVTISSFRCIPDDAVKEGRTSFCFYEISDLVVMQDFGLLIGWRHSSDGGEVILNPPDKRRLLNWSASDELVVISSYKR